MLRGAEQQLPKPAFLLHIFHEWVDWDRWAISDVQLQRGCIHHAEDEDEDEDGA